MSFLADLGSTLNTQLSIGENNTHSLDSVINGSVVKNGSLGDIASQIDQSAERRYVEEGYLRSTPYQADPKQMEILLQEPNATIFIKKRMFSSIAENFRPDYMDQDEKLYYQATKILFQNKCNRIAALEKLSKIQKITAAVGNVSEQLLPIIMTLTDQLNFGSSISPFSSGLFGGLPDSNPYSTNQISNFTAIIDKIRNVYSFNQTNDYTTWITDQTDLYQSTLGQGTGVIEITNFTNLETSATLDIDSGGSCSFSISDPYDVMTITDYDIEIALSDATNMFYNHKIFQFGTQAANQVIQNTTTALNQLRAGRNASPLTIKTDPDTLLGKRVYVIIDRLGVELQFTYNSNGSLGFPGLGGSGGSVVVDPSYLRGGSIAGYDGLDTGNSPNLPGTDLRSAVGQSELSLFQALIAAIYNQQQMQANSQNSFTNANEKTNYARRKMRFNFLGYSVIQQMDVAHIYLGSKSRYDEKVLGGLSNMLSGVGVLQNFNNTLVGVKNTFDALFRPSGSLPLQLEKSVYVGSSFPNFLWNMLRSQFVTEKEGTHCFAGVVQGVQSNWSDGKFSVSVNCKDNSIYFEQGKVNFNPGVDTFNGSMFDPLTPFKTDVNTISFNTKSNTPELLDENKDLLAGGLKFKLGTFAGTQTTASNYLQDRSIDPLSGLITKTFFAPDGLVYKWREGIGVFTQQGLSGDINDPNRVGAPNTFREPFRGQDIMNVISLLVTGIPYNFTTFYKGVLGNGNFGVDPQTNQSASFAFINSITSQIAKNNALWGNFIPFKTLSMDEQTYAKAQYNQFSIVKLNNDLDNKINQLQDLQQKETLFTAIKDYAPQSATTDPNFQDVRTQIANLQLDITTTIGNIDNQNSSFYQQAGNDPTFDYSQFTDGKKTNSVADPKTRQNLRRQINYLTRRMSYNVRANEDKNLFIVDDYYDKDTDILAYASALTDGIKIWNNEFISVKEKITLTAKLLNLEVFFDTQGHFRVRNPQYNRMPSSIFYRMMYLKQTQKIQVFPDYLNQLFTDQIDSIKTQLEVAEDEIRLDCAILGLDDDTSAVNFIQTGATNNTGSTFMFISDNTGSITDINSLIQQANPDIINQQVKHGISDFQNVKDQAGLKQVFTNSQRFAVINQAITQQQQGQFGYNTNANVNSVAGNTYVNTLITRIQSKSGQKLSVQDYITTNAVNVKAVVLPANQTIDIFKTTKDIQTKISARQQLLKTFYNTIKNAAEYKSLDSGTSISNKLITPGGFGNSNIPEVFEHMIEDETYDDYGLGSSTRYIIRRSQITNMSISSNTPPFTMVEVQGILDQTLPDQNSLPTGFNFSGSSNGGNGMVTGTAVDYDMWRNFGFKMQSPVQVPFLSDPQSQTGPYAAMILSLGRKNIIRGSITISGNEYMQPGEVVYVEDKGLLFYVNSVRHTITQGGSFKTTLELTYGHAPGEYIPTTMDFIGKLLYKNKNDATIVVHRQDNSADEESLGVLQAGSTFGVNSNSSAAPVNSGGADQTNNPVSDFNSRVINNMLFMTAFTMNNNQTASNNKMATIEVRIYYDSKNPANNDTFEFASQVQSLLIGSQDGPKNFPSATTATTNTTIPANYVSVQQVNLDDPADRRHPSQKAWDAARNQIAANNNSGAGTPGVAIRQALFGYIVDCWLVNKPVPSKTQQTNGS